MSNIHAILVPFNYTPTIHTCALCPAQSCGYFFPLHPSRAFVVFICFSCADKIFEASPGLFDETFCSGDLVLLPLKVLSRNLQNSILDFWQ